MWPDRVAYPGPLTYESRALPTALRGPARLTKTIYTLYNFITSMHLSKAKNESSVSEVLALFNCNSEG